jgi:hypothetical protein
MRVNLRTPGVGREASGDPKPTTDTSREIWLDLAAAVGESSTSVMPGPRCWARSTSSHHTRISGRSATITGMPSLFEMPANRVRSLIVGE